MTPEMMVRITAKNQTQAGFSQVVQDANAASSAMTVAGSRASAAMNGAGGATANLAAQFNDIGVMLASGQSPLLLAVQQGTQISQVFSGMKAGAAVGALKTALLSLVSPVTLITIGSIAAGAAMFQWLMSASGDAETATEAFERHRQEIEGIVAGYGAAETAVAAYFEAMATMPRSIAVAGVNGVFAQAAAEAEAFRAQMADFASDPLFSKFGSEAVRSMQALALAFSEGEITAEDFHLQLEGVKDQLNLLEQAGAPIPGSTRNMIAAWQEGALKARQFGDAIGIVIAQSHALAGLNVDGDLADMFTSQGGGVEAAMEALQRLTPELRTQQQIILDTFAQAMDDPLTTGAARDQLTAAKDAALAAVAESEGRRTSAKAATAQADAYADVIGNLEYELSLIGLSEQEQEVLNNVRAAGVAVTSEQGMAIRALTEELFAQQEATDAASKAAKEMEKNWEQAGSKAGSTLRGLLDGTKDLGDAILEIGLMALQNLDFGGLGAGGGFAKGLLGSLFGGTRATGGPVQAGKAYQVNENTPNSEWFVPKLDGYVIPNRPQGGGGRTVVINQSFSISGVTSIEDVRQLARAAGLEAYDAVKRSLPGWQTQLNREGALI